MEKTYLVHFNDLQGEEEIPWSEQCLNGNLQNLRWDIQEAKNGEALYAIKGEGEEVEKFLSSNFSESEYEIRYIFEI